MTTSPSLPVPRHDTVASANTLASSLSASATSAFPVCRRVEELPELVTATPGILRSGLWRTFLHRRGAADALEAALREGVVHEQAKIRLTRTTALGLPRATARVPPPIGPTITSADVAIHYNYW